MTPKQERAREMAKVRGEASVEWHKENVLTKETLPQFKKLMKEIDKKFKEK